MGTRIDHVAADRHVSGREHRISRGLVAGGPVEDMVAGPAGKIVPYQRRIRLERGPGVDERRQRLVLDRDQLERVARRVTVPGDHECDLLALEPHLVGREHGLHVPRQRRHPGQAALGQVRAGEHCLDLRVGQSRGGIDRDNARVRQRAAQDRAVQHPRQADVVDKRALAPHEPRVFLSRD